MLKKTTDSPLIKFIMESWLILNIGRLHVHTCIIGRSVADFARGFLSPDGEA